MVIENNDRSGLPRACEGAAGKPPPRVVHVITKLDLGGAEQVAIDLATGLSPAVQSQIFAVNAVAAPSRVGDAMREALTASEIAWDEGIAGCFKFGGVLLAAWRLSSAVRRFRADIVHLHTETPELTYAVARLIRPDIRSVPMVRTVHNSGLWPQWEGLGRWVTRQLRLARAVAVSNAAADADAAILSAGTRRRAQVIRNGVRSPIAHDSRGASQGPLRVLYAARFVPAKGTDRLPAILSACQAATARRDVRVTVAGAGPLGEGLADRINEAIPGWRVDVVPPIERVAAQLATYDAVLMPSRYEGMALLAVEALLAGTPVAASDAPGLNEALGPGYPFMAPLESDAALGRVLAAILDAPQQSRDAVMKLQPDIRRRFDPWVTMSEYHSLYRDILRAQPPG